MKKYIVGFAVLIMLTGCQGDVSKSSPELERLEQVKLENMALKTKAADLQKRIETAKASEKTLIKDNERLSQSLSVLQLRVIDSSDESFLRFFYNYTDRFDDYTYEGLKQYNTQSPEPFTAEGLINIYTEAMDYWNSNFIYDTFALIEERTDPVFFNPDGSERKELEYWNLVDFDGDSSVTSLKKSLMTHFTADYSDGFIDILRNEKSGYHYKIVDEKVFSFYGGMGYVPETVAFNTVISIDEYTPTFDKLVYRVMTPEFYLGGSIGAHSGELDDRNIRNVRIIETLVELVKTAEGWRINGYLENLE